jgi:hypothetical protein
MPASNTKVFPPWNFSRWRAVDDRVRGGRSVSHLDPVDISAELEGLDQDISEGLGEKKSAARFWGNLGMFSVIWLLTAKLTL